VRRHIAVPGAPAGAATIFLPAISMAAGRRGTEVDRMISAGASGGDMDGFARSTIASLERLLSLAPARPAADASPTGTGLRQSRAPFSAATRAPASARAAGDRSLRAGHAGRRAIADPSMMVRAGLMRRTAGESARAPLEKMKDEKRASPTKTADGHCHSPSWRPGAGGTCWLRASVVAPAPLARMRERRIAAEATAPRARAARSVGSCGRRPRRS